MTRRIHVVGAGLAGLSAAVRLSGRTGVRVTVWEATNRAGGRCWSFHDAQLDRAIDNGNHLMLSGNVGVAEYLREIGAGGRLEAQAPLFPFVDLSSGRRWAVRVPAGPIDAARGGVGLPGLGLGFAADLARLLASGAADTVAAAVRGRGPAWRCFWEPMTIAALNAPPRQASARLLAAVMRQSFLRGAGACRPLLAPQGLGHALVEPALSLLRRRGAELRLRRRLASIRADSARALALRFDGEGAEASLGARDGVVLAVRPAAFAAALGPVEEPPPGLTILNAHFRAAPGLAQRAAPMTGVVGGDAHWIFRRGDVLSVTVSAAEATALAEAGRKETLDRLWRDVAATLGCRGATPLARRLVRERAATFDQSPAGAALRPPAATRLANVVLAGDHVRSDLPATIEAAVRSGAAAADAALAAAAR